MPTCQSESEFDGRLGVRISSIFVILIGSLFGAWFPLFAASHKIVTIPSWVLFTAKYFGSGVIVATAFIHLLAPATEALANPCLTGAFETYPWVEGICLVSIFALLFVELMTTRYSKVRDGDDADLHSTEHASSAYKEQRIEGGRILQEANVGATGPTDRHHGQCDGGVHQVSDSYAAQRTGIFVLEVGIVFHSIFIGLTLAVSGLALGTRVASINWPEKRKWTPYALGAGYSLSTPLAIAIGLGVRSTYRSGGQSALISNGVFDSISAGVLIYTALVELMARDFIFSSHLQHAPISKVLSAFGTMCCGAGLMALLGKWE